MKEARRPGATENNLKQSFSKAGLEETEGAGDETPDELTKDVATNNTKCDDPEGLATEKVRDSKPQENVFTCDTTSQDLGEAGRMDASTTDGDNLREKVMEAVAQDVAALSVPRDQQPKKRTREVRGR